MKKKILGIYACILLVVVTALPSIGVINDDKNIRATSDNYCNLAEQVIGRSSVSSDWLEKKLLASDGASQDRFGFSVSIDGDYVIVGAHSDDSRTGSAYVFKRSGSTWTEEQKLTASDGAEGDRFGWPVSIDGAYVIAGAYKDDSGTGSAYVFKRNGTSWTEEQKLTASDGATWDQFGYSVSINGDYAIAGANCDDDHGGMSGSAYVFKRNGTSWTEEQKLTAPDGAESDFFGRSVSIDGDYTIIGASGDDGFTGSTYVFKRSGSTWTKEKKLTASDGGMAEEFGWSVSINGNNAIIGAHTDNDYGANSGSAYVFMKDDGTHSPDKPSVEGPASGTVGTEYEYTFNTVDPNGDDVYYYIEWGDDDFEDWIGPYSSGDDVKLNHTWHKRGTYMIRARAKDPYDYESGWGYLEVTMPLNHPSSNSFVLQFLQRRIHQFPILEQILSSSPLYSRMLGL